MFALPSTLHEMLAPPLLERLSLLINHVLWREPAAQAQLRPHAGRLIVVALEDLPSWLPPAPALAWRVTPAGLLAWCPQPGPDAADLHVRLSLGPVWPRALQLLAGQRPPVRIEGDATLAAAVDWLFANLRWDVADDLQRLAGPVLAQALVDAATAARQALSGFVASLAPGGARG